jgi:hypothetical protein
MLQQERDVALIRAQRVDTWVLLMRDLGGGVDVDARDSGISKGEDHAR